MDLLRLYWACRGFIGPVEALLGLLRLYWACRGFIGPVKAMKTHNFHSHPLSAEHDKLHCGSQGGVLHTIYKTHSVYF